MQHVKRGDETNVQYLLDLKTNGSHTHDMDFWEFTIPTPPPPPRDFYIPIFEMETQFHPGHT